MLHGAGARSGRGSGRDEARTGNGCAASDSSSPAQVPEADQDGEGMNGSGFLARCMEQRSPMRRGGGTM
jgi:hypothetical protein